MKRVAPSTALRAVPLPRFAGEDPGTVAQGSSPVHGGGGAWWRGRKDAP